MSDSAASTPAAPGYCSECGTADPNLQAERRLAATRHVWPRTCCVYCGQRIGADHWRTTRWRFPLKARRLACIRHAHLVARDPEYTS